MTTYPGDDPQTPDDPQDTAAQPPQDDVPTPEAPEGTEPTQPVGYWERRANDEAAERAHLQGGQPYPTTPYPQGEPVYNPTSAQSSAPTPASYEQAPYGQGPSAQTPTPPASPGYGQDGYGQTPYGQTPYGQPQYSQGPYAQPGPAAYGGQPMGSPPAPGQPAPYAPMPPYGGFVARPPDHPQATLSFILGLVGLVGFLFCGVTLLVSPFAWGIGRSALAEIRNSQGRLGGESAARTGMILGIIGTALLMLAVIALIVFIVLVAAGATTGTTTGSSV